MINRATFATAGFICFVMLGTAQAGLLKDIGNAVTAPVRAPVQMVQDLARGKPPSEVVQNQINIRVGAPAVAAGSVISLAQRGNDFINRVPRDAIRDNLGGDWARGWDALTASDRIQREIAFTSGAYLAGCAATGQCGIDQLAAVPLAAHLRDAYKVHIGYSSPLPPEVQRALMMVAPANVVMNARWTIGRLPDMTIPGFLNAGQSVFGNKHAVTIGNLMIFSQMPDLRYANDWVWLLHELFHIEQYGRFSPDVLEAIDGFSVAYMRNYNGMENEAQNAADMRWRYLAPYM